MSRLIDADALKVAHGMKDDCADCDKELRGKSRSCEFDRIYSLMDFCGWLDDAPTIEPERKTARWIPRGCGCFECNECGERVTLNAYTAEKASDRFRFCYHCGARMEEGEAE